MLEVCECNKLYNINEVILLQLECKYREEFYLHSLIQQQSVTNEIMKYKELLDEGILTEKEFTIKEKELLRKLRK